MSHHVHTLHQCRGGGGGGGGYVDASCWIEHRYERVGQREGMQNYLYLLHFEH